MSYSIEHAKITVRKLLYVSDDDDVAWEFIEYFSDSPAERNDYKV